MADAFFAALRNGTLRRPDSMINGMGPLPMIPPGAPQFSTPDGEINNQASLLPGGFQYAKQARISTQTQQAHPNRVQLVIPKLRIPAAESDGLDLDDPVLEHAVSDGDLIFTFRIGVHMMTYGTQYVQAPYGFASKATPVLNLATVNYILWGLQVGLSGPRSTRWKAFFAVLTKHAIRQGRERWSEDAVWNFVQTYMRPFAIQHGGDQQGGMHEGSDNNIVTHGAVDYVASMMIEGKARHVNNLWTGHDVHENDDLILMLRFKEPPHGEIPFVLSSSSRATRNERVPVGKGFYYLRPEILQYRTFTDTPYIHIGRSQKYCSAFQRSIDSCAFDARAPVTPGAPLQITFEPEFVDSAEMVERRWEISGPLAPDNDPSILTGPASDAAAALIPDDSPARPHTLPPAVRITSAAFAVPAAPAPADEAPKQAKKARTAVAPTTTTAAGGVFSMLSGSAATTSAAAAAAAAPATAAKKSNA